jgi:serine/threonine protein kinase
MNDREAVRDEIEKVTTPIYRAPEQLDLFKGYKINTKVDIWALGCIMFTLMYHKPPFEDGQKLAQINGKFRLQDSPAYSDDCISLLKAMLRANPDDRPTAQQIYDRTLKLCGNTKDIVPRIEFKFAQAV